jgi:hypothetical protein
MGFETPTEPLIDAVFDWGERRNTLGFPLVWWNMAATPAFRSAVGIRQEWMGLPHRSKAVDFGTASDHKFSDTKLRVFSTAGSG